MRRGKIPERKCARPRRGGVSAAALLTAAALFLASLGCFLFSLSSPERQAEEWLGRLYTVKRSLDLPALYGTGIPQVYEDAWGPLLTEDGKESLAACGMPYLLLLSPIASSEVEQAGVREISLTPLAAEDGTAVYEYRVQVELRLEKGLSERAPTETITREGTLSLKRKSLFRWQLDGFS